jgi:hypothetical protein
MKCSKFPANAGSDRYFDLAGRPCVDAVAAEYEPKFSRGGRIVSPLYELGVDLPPGDFNGGQHADLVVFGKCRC